MSSYYTRETGIERSPFRGSVRRALRSKKPLSGALPTCLATRIKTLGSRPGAPQRGASGGACPLGTREAALPNLREDRKGEGAERKNNNSLMRKQCCERRTISLMCRRFLSYSGIILRPGGAPGLAGVASVPLMFVGILFS